MAHMIFEFKDLLILAIAIVSGWNFIINKKVEYKLAAVLGEDKNPTSTTFDISTLPPIDTQMYQQQQPQQQQYEQHYEQQQQQYYQQQPQINHEEEEAKARAAKILALSGVSTKIIVAPPEHGSGNPSEMAKPFDASKDNGNAGVESYTNLAKMSKHFVFGGKKNNDD